MLGTYTTEPTWEGLYRPSFPLLDNVDICGTWKWATA